MRQVILRMENVVTESAEVRGLNDMSLLIGTGEIVGMITINQHGIKDLTKMLRQQMAIKEGQFFFDEKKVSLKERPQVCFIDRKTRLVEGLTIAENLFVIRKSFTSFIIKKKALEEEAQRVLNHYHLPLEATIDVGKLNHLKRCQVELLKAVLTGAKLVVIKDLGKILSYTDLNVFKQMVLDVAHRGVAFLYISHYPDEAFSFCRRHVVYENGKIIKTFYSGKVEDKDLIPYLPAITKQIPKKPTHKIPILRVNKCHFQQKIKDSTTVHQGECLVIFDGNQTLLPTLLEGFKQQVTIKYPFEIIFEKTNLNLLVIPENASQRTLFYDCSYLFNLTFLLDQKLKKSILPKKLIRSIIQEFSTEIKEVVDLQSLDRLNKYELIELVYYKALLQRPNLVIIYQPFVGIDMDLQRHIEKLIHKLTQRMITVIVLTSYLANLEVVSDYVIKVENQ